MTQQKYDFAEIYDFDEDFFYVFTLDADGGCITGHAVEYPEDGTLTALLTDLAENGTATWDNALDDVEAHYATMQRTTGCTGDGRVIAAAWPDDAETRRGYRVYPRGMSRFGRAWAGLDPAE